MPVFQYRCPACDERFEERRGMIAADRLPTVPERAVPDRIAATARLRHRAALPAHAKRTDFEIHDQVLERNGVYGSYCDRADNESDHLRHSERSTKTHLSGKNGFI
jgi:hypothetical protein